MGVPDSSDAEYDATSYNLWMVVFPGLFAIIVSNMTASTLGGGGSTDLFSVRLVDPKTGPAKNAHKKTPYNMH